MLEKSNSLDLFKFKEKETIRKQRYYKNNAESIKEKVAKHNKLNPEKRKLVVKKSFIKCKYGIIYEDYLSMHREQEYRCKICKRHADEFKKGLVVDHDHKTGHIRGLLCTRCNITLGHYEKCDKESFEKYLNKHRKDLN
jgi:hypothetical protein